MTKKIILLGATGSVGSSVLSVVEHFPDEFELLGFSAWNNLTKSREIIQKFSPKYVALQHPNEEFYQEFPNVHFFQGSEGLIALSEIDESDCVISAITGTHGLKPALHALKKSKILITANKEALVAGGALLMQVAQTHNTQIIPLDSEHLALFDLMRGKNISEVDELVITASGGPFRQKDITPDTTIEEVLKHPTWNMGATITVSSALMLNKGLEVIEAMRLFNLPEHKIRVLVHPQSLVHAALNMKGGHWHFLASPTDMRYPALHSMSYPKHPTSTPFGHFDPIAQPLEFFEPDLKKFPLLHVSREVGKEDGILPTILCGAMEIAIEAFLNREILFYHLPYIIRKTIDSFENYTPKDLNEILHYDKLSRQKIKELIKISSF